MYLNIGGETVKKRDIIGIFDPDSVTVSAKTRETLKKAEEKGRLQILTDDIPRAIIIEQQNGEDQTLYFSPVSLQTLTGRLKEPF